MTPVEPVDPDEPRRFDRRRFVGGALATGAALAGGGFGVGRATTRAAASTPATTNQVPFFGAHQAGIATTVQDRLAFAAFDLTTTDRTAIEALLGTWAAAADLMTQGEPISSLTGNPDAPPVDTGEAVGLAPANLTVTVGFGPSLFDHRFGLAHRRPAALTELPALPGDQLKATRSGGDIGVQACSDDPQVAFHVIRNFARLARGTAVMRWSQLGFGKTATTSRTEATPRNLMGFKDGTNNIKLQDVDDLDDYVWVGDESDQDWLRGGSYLVARRINMHIESWDTDYLADQENVIGRYKASGAPLTGHSEFDTVNLAAHNAAGKPVIPLNAHIRLAAPASNGGQKLLRRGYSFTDGIEPGTGLLDAGLFFIAYQKNPHDQFVRIQRQLGQRDLLNEYIQHTGSALFAVPPGVARSGDWFGKALFT